MLQNPHAEGGSSPPQPVAIPYTFDKIPTHFRDNSSSTSRNLNSLTRILEALSRTNSLLTKSGTGWVALCPAHDDRKQSLSVSRGDTQPFILKCHAGCTFQEVMAALRRKLELSPSDQPQPSSASRGDLGPVVATYRYCNDRGQLVYEVVRHEPKTFRQRHVAADGTLVWGLPPEVPRYLYRLHEILERKKRPTTVFVAEGEKDIDALWALKLPATTNVGGAGKWRPEYTEQLVAAGIPQAVIFADNDDAGQKHAHGVAAALHAAGLTVKVVDLPDVPEKGDVSDYLEAHTKDGLFELVRRTPVWAPAPRDLQAERIRRFGGIIATNMGTVQPEPVNWLWPDRIPRGMLTIIAGPPGITKSYVSLDIAAHITTGAIWPDIGRAAPEGTVLLLAAEDSASHTIRPRLDRLNADASRVEKIDAVQLDDGKGRKTFSLADDIVRLETMARETGAQLIIVDPVNSYLGGKIDGFKDVEVRSILDPLKEMAERLNVAVVLIMHVKKGAEEEVLYRIGGSVGFPALARTVFFCTRDPNEPGRIFFSNPKLNIAPEAKTLAYRVGLDGGLQWDREEIKLTAREVLELKGTPGPKPVVRDEVVRWLLDTMRAAGGKRLGSEVTSEAVERGYSLGTLRRAREALGITVDHVNVRDKKTGKLVRAEAASTWTLPAAILQPKAPF